jgi:membrane-associated phospholipid phosphatase
MEVLTDFGPEFSRWLQENYPQLESLMAFISQLGHFNFYLVAVPLIYWSLNKRLGAHLIYLLTLSNAIGETLKQAFRDPRPFWYDPAVGLAEEPTYGIPSNHALVSTVAYLSIAGWFRRGWLWLLAVLWIVLISLSRIYLGVHDLPDVLFGAAIGLLVLGGYVFWRNNLLKRFNNRILGQKLLVALFATATLTVLFLLLLLLIGEAIVDNPDWRLLVEEAERAGLDGATANIASLLGLGVGLLFESARIRFQVDGPVWKRTLRYLVGIIITLLIFFGLRSVFPDTDEAPYILSLPLRFLRYFITSLWVSYYAPALFVRLNLADRQINPEGITISE